MNSYTTRDGHTLRPGNEITVCGRPGIVERIELRGAHIAARVRLDNGWLWFPAETLLSLSAS